jgi:hypothetical protein
VARALARMRMRSGASGRSSDRFSDPTPHSPRHGCTAPDYECSGATAAPAAPPLEWHPRLPAGATAARAHARESRSAPRSIYIRRSSLCVGSSAWPVVFRGRTACRPPSPLPIPCRQSRRGGLAARRRAHCPSLPRRCRARGRFRSRLPGGMSWRLGCAGGAGLYKLTYSGGSEVINTHKGWKVFDGAPGLARTSGPGRAHVCAGTRARRHQDTRTSAPGLTHLHARP